MLSHCAYWLPAMLPPLLATAKSLSQVAATVGRNLNWPWLPVWLALLRLMVPVPKWYVPAAAGSSWTLQLVWLRFTPPLKLNERPRWSTPSLVMLNEPVPVMSPPANS
ncbi:MAG: hypothetical protein BWZ02_01822 [Lentisphaerae bacterium ADurb.BinA184]|nr:MAG: hypothetical protein BWZ02_01822 [Lentisphaerae bacterium ADurb.BinA184]